MRSHRSLFKPLFLLTLGWCISGEIVDCRATEQPSERSYRLSEQTLDAIWLVESDFRLNPPPGDGGKAVGPYQIQPIYVREANRLAEAYVFSYDLRHDLEASRELCRIVVGYWAQWHLRQGHYEKITTEICASIHRRPTAAWRLHWMNEPEEIKRTNKIRTYLRTIALGSEKECNNDP